MLRIGSTHARTGRRGASAGNAIVFQQLRTSSSSSSSIPHFRPRQSFGAPLGSSSAKTVTRGNSQHAYSSHSHPAGRATPATKASVSDWQCAECFFKNEASSESCFGCGNAKPSLSDFPLPPLSSLGSTYAAEDNQMEHAEERTGKEDKKEQPTRDGQTTKTSNSNASPRMIRNEAFGSAGSHFQSIREDSHSSGRSDVVVEETVGFSLKTDKPSPSLSSARRDNIHYESTPRTHHNATEFYQSNSYGHHYGYAGDDGGGGGARNSNDREGHYHYHNRHGDNHSSSNETCTRNTCNRISTEKSGSNSRIRRSGVVGGESPPSFIGGGTNQSERLSVLSAADMARREARLQAQTDALIEHQSRALELRGRLYGDKSCERLNRVRASDEGNVDTVLADNNEGGGTPQVHHQGRDVVAFNDDLHSGPTSLLCRQMGIRSRNSRLYLKEKILKTMRPARSSDPPPFVFSQGNSGPSITSHQQADQQKDEHNATNSNLSGDPAYSVFARHSFPFADAVEGLSYTDPSTGEPTAVVGLSKVTPEEEQQVVGVVTRTSEGRQESNPTIVGGVNSNNNSNISNTIIGANAHNFTSDMGIARLSSALTVYRRNKIEMVVDYVSRWRERRELLGISATNDDFGVNSNNNKACGGDGVVKRGGIETEVNNGGCVESIKKEEGEKTLQHICSNIEGKDEGYTVPASEENEKEETNKSAFSTEENNKGGSDDSVNIGGGGFRRGAADAPSTASDIYLYDDVLVSVVGGTSAEEKESHQRDIRVADNDLDDALNESAWGAIVESECSSGSQGWASSSSSSVPLSKAKEQKRKMMNRDSLSSMNASALINFYDSGAGIGNSNIQRSLPYTEDQEAMAEDAVKAVIGANKRGATRVLDFDTISWAAEGFVDSSEMLEQISRSRRCLSAQDRIFTVPCIVEKKTNITVRALSRNYSDYFVVVNTFPRPHACTQVTSPSLSPSSLPSRPMRVTEVKFLMTRRMLRESGRAFYLRAGMPPTLDPLFIGVARPHLRDVNSGSGNTTNTWESAAAAATYTPNGKRRRGSTHQNQANERQAAILAIKAHLETNFELLWQAREQYHRRRAEHRDQQEMHAERTTPNSVNENLTDHRDRDLISSDSLLLSPAASAMLKQLIANPTAFVDERFQTLADQKHRRQRLHQEMMILTTRMAASTPDNAVRECESYNIKAITKEVTVGEKGMVVEREEVQEGSAASGSVLPEPIEASALDRELASLKKAIAAADEVYDARVRGLIAMLINASTLDAANEDPSTRSHTRSNSSPFSVSMREKDKMLREAYSFLIEKYFGSEIRISSSEEEGQPSSGKMQGQHGEVKNDAGVRSNNANATDDDDYKAMMNATSPTLDTSLTNEIESKKEPAGNNKIPKYKNTKRTTATSSTSSIPEDEDGDMLVTPEELLDFDIRRAAVHQVMGSFESSSSNSRKSARRKRGEANDDDDYENDVDTIIVSTAKKVDPLLVERRLARSRELQTFPLHIMNTIKRLQNHNLKRDIGEVARAGVEDGTNALGHKSSALPNDNALRRSELYAASQILVQRLNLKRLTDLHDAEGGDTEASNAAVSLRQHSPTGHDASSSSPPELAVVMMASLSVPVTSVYMNWRDTLRSSSAACSNDTNVNESHHSYSSSSSAHKAHDKDGPHEACLPQIQRAAGSEAVGRHHHDDLTTTNINRDHVASSLLCDDSLPSKAQLRELVVSELNPLLRWRCGACNLINVRPLISEKKKTNGAASAQTADKDPWSSVHHVCEDQRVGDDVLLSVAVGKQQIISSNISPLPTEKQARKEEAAAPFVAFRDALDNALFGHDEDKRSFSLLAEVKREMENKNTSMRKGNRGVNNERSSTSSVDVQKSETPSTSPSPTDEDATGITSGSQDKGGGGVPGVNNPVVPTSQPFPWKSFDLAALLKQQKEAGAPKGANASDNNFGWGNCEWGESASTSWDSNVDISASWAWGGDDNKTASATTGCGWGPSAADTHGMSGMSASYSSFLGSSKAAPSALLEDETCRCYACGTLSTESTNSNSNYSKPTRLRGVSRQQYQGNEREQEYEGWRHQHQAVEGRRGKKWQANTYNQNDEDGHHRNYVNRYSSNHSALSSTNNASWNPWDRSANVNGGDNRSWQKMQQRGQENTHLDTNSNDNRGVGGEYIPLSSANNATTASTSDFYEKIKKSASSTACGFAVNKEQRTVSFVGGGDRAVTSSSSSSSSNRTNPSTTEDIAAAINATEMELQPLDMYHSHDDEANQMRQAAQNYSAHVDEEENNNNNSSSSFWAGEGGFSPSSSSSSFPTSSPPYYEWKDLSGDRDQPLKTTSFGILGSVGTGDTYGSVDIDNTRIVRDQVDQHLKYRKPRLTDVAPGTHDTMSEHEKVRRLNLLLAGIADNVNVRQQLIAQKLQQQVDDDHIKGGNVIDSHVSARETSATAGDPKDLKKKRGYGRYRNSPPSDSASASKVTAVLGADTITSGSTAAVVSLSDRWKAFGQQTVYRPYHGFTNNSDIEKFSGQFSRTPTRFEEDIEADIQRRLPPHLREHKAVREARNAFFASYKPASSKLASTLFAEKEQLDDDNKDSGSAVDCLGVAEEHDESLRSDRKSTKNDNNKTAEKNQRAAARPFSPLLEDDTILPPRASVLNALPNDDN